MGETIVLGVRDGAGERETQRVCALEAGTGETVWQFRAPAPLAAVAVAQDRLVLIEGRVAESEGEQFPSRVFCVSPGSGREEWVADIREAARWWNVVEKRWKPGSVGFGVAVHAGRVLCPVDGGQIVCLDLRDGRLRWTYRFEGGYPTEPVLVGDRVYFMYFDRYFCLDAETGQEVLQVSGVQPCIAPVYPGLAVGDLYVFGTGEGLYALELDTGRTVWSHTGRHLRTPVVSGGRLYTTWQDEHVYGFGPEALAPKRRRGRGGKP